MLKTWFMKKCSPCALVQQVLFDCPFVVLCAKTGFKSLNFALGGRHHLDWSCCLWLSCYLPWDIWGSHSSVFIRSLLLALQSLHHDYFRVLCCCLRIFCRWLLLLVRWAPTDRQILVWLFRSRRIPFSCHLPRSTSVFSPSECAATIADLSVLDVLMCP